MVRAIHRQPVGEMTESLEHDRAVVAKIMVLGAAVNQDALARCKYLLILAGQCRDMVCIGLGWGFGAGGRACGSCRFVRHRKSILRVVSKSNAAV